MEKPLLSVFVITYKHALFIEKAICSILDQDTNFNYEVIIANDCSPDKTSTIISDLMKSHPKGDIIRYFEHEQNLGMHANFVFALKQCNGKYIAICEGDDYWLNSLKLQKQVEFLESNLSYEVCFTNVCVVDERNKIKNNALIKNNFKTDYDRKDLPIWAPTLTRVFRNRDFESLPFAPGLDTIMLLWQSQFGSIKFINTVMGAYRQHEGGIYSGQNRVKQIEHTLKTDLISLSLIETTMFSKYFGILFKKLVELRFLDNESFKINKSRVYSAFYNFKRNLSWSLIIKIRLSFIIISLPFLSKNKNLRFALFKILNHLFIYPKKNTDNILDLK